MKLVLFPRCVVNLYHQFFRTTMRISRGRRFGTCNSSRSMGFWRWNGRWRRRTWYVRDPLEIHGPPGPNRSVRNRSVLIPGSLVKMSFSMDDDSLTRIHNFLGELRSTWNAFAVSYRDNKDQSMTELWRKHFEEQTLTEVGKKLFIWICPSIGHLRCYL